MRPSLRAAGEPPMAGRDDLRRMLRWRLAVRESNLPSSAKLVALVLDTFMNKSGESWPSVRLLARSTSLSEATVRWHLRILEIAGYVYTLDRWGQFVGPSNPADP